MTSDAAHAAMIVPPVAIDGGQDRREARMPGTSDPAGRDTILVYRDRLVPRSELHFLRRLYVGFQRLDPLWVGRWRDDGLADLGGESVFLGRNGAFGAIDR